MLSIGETVFAKNLELGFKAKEFPLASRDIVVFEASSAVSFQRASMDESADAFVDRIRFLRYAAIQAKLSDDDVTEMELYDFLAERDSLEAGLGGRTQALHAAG